MRTLSMVGMRRAMRFRPDPLLHTRSRARRRQRRLHMN